MRVDIDYGLEHLDLDIPERKLVGMQRQPPAPSLTDPAAAVRQALEAPLNFPALKRALTPDDHVVIVLDDGLPRPAELVAPIIDHVLEAHVSLDAITLVEPVPTAGAWLGNLPGRLQGVSVEVHDPLHRDRLSYLATTQRGRRIYLNRTAVDADQLVVIARQGYDPLLGYSGCEGAIYPGLSDESTRQEMMSRLSNLAPGAVSWPTCKEAEEVAWLLGAPFMVRVIEGSGSDILHVVGGLANTSGEGRRLLDARWRVTLDQEPETVVVVVGGDSAALAFADLAQALACAARVVVAGGRIILLSTIRPVLGRGAELLRETDSAESALAAIRREAPTDFKAAFQWATAVQKAEVYLLSGLEGETAEELFAIPLEHGGQVQRLLGDNKSYALVTDAHKTMVVVKGE